MPNEQKRQLERCRGGRGQGGLETFPEEGLELGLERRPVLCLSPPLELQEPNDGSLAALVLTGDACGAPHSLTVGGEHRSALVPLLEPGWGWGIRSCQCFFKAPGSCSLPQPRV